MLYEDARRVGSMGINGHRLDVFASTTAVYDTESGVVSMRHMAVVLDDVSGEATEKLPQPCIRNSRTGVKMHAIRVAVLAAVAWEGRVARYVQAAEEQRALGGAS